MEAHPARGHNYNIDIAKLMYAWCVVLCHFYSDTYIYFGNGRFAVEFFLITAGIFFFKAWERDESAPPGKYLYKRYMRFLPWTTTAFIFTFVVRRVVIAGNTPRQLIENLSKDIWEVLLIKMNGINHGGMLLNWPIWTLSAMLLVEIVMIGCLYCNKKAVINIVIPVSIIVGYGYWRNISSADAVGWIGFTTFGVFRAWIVYCCAYYCLRLSELLAKIRFTVWGQVVLTAVETLCHIFAVLAISFLDSRYWQWCTTLAFFIAIAIALSGHSLWNVILSKAAGVIKHLGALSLCTYVIHGPIVKYFEYIYPDMEVRYSRVGQYAAVVIIASVAHYLLVKWMIRAWRVYGPKIKRAFVEAA